MPCSRGGGTHPQKNAVGAECSPAGGHRGWLQVHPLLGQAVQRAVQQFSIACVAIVRDHYLFLLKQECEDRVRFAINSARVYPLLQLHYYIQSRPDEVQNPKPSATIQPSDSGPLVRRRDRLLHPPPQADHLAPQEEYSSKKSHWDRESENDPTPGRSPGVSEGGRVGQTKPL